MQIGRFSIGFKEKAREAQPPQTETAYVQSLLYSMFDFMPYDPDDLKVAKGADVYKKVLRDEQVKAAARFRRNSVTGRKWMFMFEDDVDLSDEEKDRRVKVMEQAVRTMPGSFKRSLDGIMSAMFFGFSMSEKTYQPFEYNGTTYWGLKAVRTKPHDTFLFHKEPTGELDKVVQRVESHERELDISRFIHHVYNTDVDEHYGQSELRECYRAYWSKDVIIKLQNVYLERMAGGFVWTSPKDDAENPTPGSVEEANMRAVLSNIQTKTGIMMPKGIGLNVEHPSSTDAFERAIIQYNLAIAKGLLMPNLIGLSEQGPNGSRALGDTQLEAFLWMLDAETGDLEETLNEQLFRELGMFNFADGIIPAFKFKPLSQSMIKIIATLWGDLVQKGAVTKSDSDEAWLRDMLGAPEKIEEEEDDGTEGEEEEDDGTGEDEDEGTAPPDNEEEAEDETVVGRGELTIEYNAFSRAQQRVDFARIDSSANISQWQNVEALSSLFGDLTGEVAEFIRNNPDIADNPDKIKEVKVPGSTKAQLKKTVRRILKDGWDIGTTNAEQEIARASGKRMSKKFSAKFASIGDIATKYFAAKEFTVTGKLLSDYESIIRNSILTGIKYSKSTEDIIADMTRQLGKQGMIAPEFVDDMLGEALETTNPRARLETVVRTNMFDAVNESRFSYFTDSELGGFVRSMEYSAILDSRTTDICRELDNKVLPVGASEWDRLRPPNHFNCRSILVAVTERDDISDTGLPDSISSGDVTPGEGFS